MIPNKDSEGNKYDFGFGMNWKGVIKDTRTVQFKNRLNLILRMIY